MPVAFIDGNSIGHANNAATRLTVGDREVQAIFGTLNSIRNLKVKRARYMPVMLWDGRAQWRYDLYPPYKAKRELDPNKKPKPYEIKAQQARESYREQKPEIQRGLRLLGVRQVTPPNDEADDLAGHLSGECCAKNIPVLLVSRDHDWLQLVRENVDWLNPVDNVLVTQKTFEEYTGYKDPKKFLMEKALLGDSSDNITGVAGIGPKAAPLILNGYSTLAHLIQEIRLAGPNWKPSVPELNKFRKKVYEFAHDLNSEGIKVYQRNMKLMNLIDSKVESGVEIVREPINVDGFLDFCHEHNFRSIIRNKDEWLRPFMEK